MNDTTEIMIITGMSGAGKSRAIEVFEDMDYNCVDNMPPALISKFVEICCGAGNRFRKLCIVVDCRAGELLDSFSDELAILKENGYLCRVLFLEASDDVLKRRYKETRRRHPLEKISNGQISEAILMEREILKPIRAESDFVVDTSLSTAKTLKELITQKFSKSNHNLLVTVMSFGFKHGAQGDADVMLDVRCLPNPYYNESLRPLTGLDKSVYDYVFAWDESNKMFDKIVELVDFSLPLYSKEGRSNLTIAFGCTGGQHRSVAFAKRLGEYIAGLGYDISIIHRDIDK